MPTSTKAVGDELDRSLEHLLDTATTAIELANQSILKTRHLEEVLAGLAVLAHAEIEGFLERLFTGLMAGALIPVNASRVRPLIRAKSYEHARWIVIGRNTSNEYATWLPYSNTKAHAERLFRSGRPFTDISSEATTALHQLHHVRNALAHSSDRSLAMFRKHCIGDRPLPSWQLRPAGFLRGPHSGQLTRIEHYLAECRVGVVCLAD